MTRADSVRVAYPLFQTEGGGSIPTSALQLKIHHVTWERFVELNGLWHSRLPDVGAYYVNGIFFGATFSEVYYAVAGWSEPIARMLNGQHCFELRRFAISPDSPPNSASRIISIMSKKIKMQRPDVERLISYQDTEVHKGTIYKAAGWVATRVSEANDQNWIKTHPRRSTSLQTTSAKIRWEKVL